MPKLSDILIAEKSYSKKISLIRVTRMVFTSLKIQLETALLML